MGKPILCVDFDGVIHSYSSGWKGADVVSDPPVPGAMRFLWDATEHFRIAIFSSRSNQAGGIKAMQRYVEDHFRYHWAGDRTTCDDKLAEIEWPTEKPPALVTLDDRAIQFDGSWPDMEILRSFKPWNKRVIGANGTFSQGPLNDDDQGDLKMAVAYDPIDGIVRVEFGKPVAWLGLPKENAVALARALLKSAGAKKVEVEF